MIIGIITYDKYHLKTEQVLKNLIFNEKIEKINIFALPFHERKKRKIQFEHRPEQKLGLHPKHFLKYKKVTFNNWDGKSNLPQENKIFLITGASIIDPNVGGNIGIINAHPGIIPTIRGLDSFKWAIYYKYKLGITLHYIDKEVDKGRIITVVETPIYKNDTLIQLANRHYELEIETLSNFLYHIKNPKPLQCEIKNAKMRMPFDKEQEMIKRFEDYKLKFGG